MGHQYVNGTSNGNLSFIFFRESSAFLKDNNEGLKTLLNKHKSINLSLLLNI